MEAQGAVGKMRMPGAHKKHVKHVTHMVSQGVTVPGGGESVKILVPGVTIGRSHAYYCFFDHPRKEFVEKKAIIAILAQFSCLILEFPSEIKQVNTQVEIEGGIDFSQAEPDPETGKM